MSDQHSFVSASVCEWSGERACCDRDTLIMNRPEIVCMGCRVTRSWSESCPDNTASVSSAFNK